MKTTMHLHSLFTTATLIGGLALNAQGIGLLKYSGGGDWYANPTALSNLIAFSNRNIGTAVEPQAVTVEPGSKELFDLPFVHLTGHGNVVFSEQELENMRRWLDGGGFLHVDDNYGMDPYIRPLLEKLFPDSRLEKIPSDHPVFKTPFEFPEGLPKVHEHDNKAPEAWGITRNGRLVVFYSYECDLGDGWEDPSVHGDSEELRTKALKMGTNLIWWAFMN